MKNFFKKIISATLTLEAKLVLKKYKPKIVAITGSVGKTSTKDAIYSALAVSLFVRKSEKSFNSEIGIPLTVLGRENGWSNPIVWLQNIFYGISLILFRHTYPDWLVLEVGADRPGDIEKAAQWIQPDVTVITSFGEIPVHVEFFKTPEAVFREKGHLVSAVKEGGVVILNIDDKNFEYFKSLSRQRILTYGFMDELADMKGSHDSITYEEIHGQKMPSGINFKANYKGSSFPVNLHGVLGVQHIYPALAALTVGTSQNISLLEMTEALKEHAPPPGRMRLLPGMKETTLIDDTYNASPVAMEKAIDTLDQVEVRRGARKIALLGDMMELGKYSADEHKKAGAFAADVCHVLVTVGVRARGIAEGALNEGMDESKIFQFDDSMEAGKFVQTLIKKGDVILAKGSQFVRMERAVKELMAHPEDAEDLLVRQSEQWEKR